MKIDSCALLPKARSKGLVSKEVDGELLIYDRTHDRAHCLNETAAAIWKQCDGRRSVREITVQWSRHVGRKAEPPRHLRGLLSKVRNHGGSDEVCVPEDSRPFDERVVWLALHQLRRAHLLEDVNDRIFSAPTISDVRNMSRREAVRRIGFGAAIALPTVISMTAPTPALAAASCKHHCDPCSSPVECCGTCSTSVSGCTGSPRCT